MLCGSIYNYAINFEIFGNFGFAASSNFIFREIVINNYILYFIRKLLCAHAYKSYVMKKDIAWIELKNVNPTSKFIHHTSFSIPTEHWFPRPSFPGFEWINRILLQPHPLSEKPPPVKLSQQQPFLEKSTPRILRPLQGFPTMKVSQGSPRTFFLERGGEQDQKYWMLQKISVVKDITSFMQPLLDFSHYIWVPICSLVLLSCNWARHIYKTKAKGTSLQRYHIHHPTNQPWICCCCSSGVK